MLLKVIYTIQNRKCYIKFGNSKNIKKLMTHNTSKYEPTPYVTYTFLINLRMYGLK